jgi:hypothetical protein
MRRVVLSALVAAGFAILGSQSAQADEPVIKQLYGGGVHAYFTRDYKEAYDLLSSAVDTNTQDPRVYYFRGLAQLQLGRPDEAKVDFAKGADLEATATDDLFGVDKALERVQGKARLSIETERVAARNRAVKRRLTEDEERYNRIRSNEPNILEGLTPPAKAPATKKAEPTKVEPIEPTEGEPKKADEPPKANPTGEPAKVPDGAEPPADPAGELLREGRPKVTPRKAVADDSKAAPAKTVEAAPGEPKEPEPKPAEKAPAEKAKNAAAARPASPPGKKATVAVARIVGEIAQEYVQEMAQAIQQAQPFPPGAGPIPPDVPKQP